MGSPTAFPVAAFHSRTVPSLLPAPVKTDFPSGLNATALTQSLICQGQADGLAGGGVPEPRCVPAPGEEGLAVGD